MMQSMNYHRCGNASTRVLNSQATVNEANSAVPQDKYMAVASVVHMLGGPWAGPARA